MHLSRKKRKGVEIPSQRKLEKGEVCYVCIRACVYMCMLIMCRYRELERDAVGAGPDSSGESSQYLSW